MSAGRVYLHQEVPPDIPMDKVEQLIYDTLGDLDTTQVKLVFDILPGSNGSLLLELREDGPQKSPKKRKISS